MQPLIPGVIKLDAASAYVRGMQDTDSTLRGLISALIRGLSVDGVFDKLRYLGVAQTLEWDTNRCLVRRATAYSTKFQYGYAPLLHVSARGYRVDLLAAPQKLGTISSGFTPDPADLGFRDAFGLFNYYSSVGDNADHPYACGRSAGLVSTSAFYNKSGATAGVYTLADAIGGALTGLATTASVPAFVYLGRDSSSSVRTHYGASVATSLSTRTGSWTWYAGPGYDSTIHHGGLNIAGTPSPDSSTADGRTLSAWGCTDGTLDTTQVNALRTRLATYLTAIGAI